MKNNKKKGFTLMELLIVIAIIAVLVAIAIPAFNGALTKAKEAADVANIRAAVAEAQVAILTDDTPIADAWKAPTDLNYSDKLTDNATEDGTIVYQPEKINGKKAYTWELVEPTVE